MLKFFMWVSTVLICMCSTDIYARKKSKQKLPLAIKQKISAIQKEKVWNPAAKIYSYVYHGQKVYYFPAHCCDIQSEVLDAKGKIICRPDGGITGKGDGKCEDFFTSRSNEKLIWEDKRVKQKSGDGED